MTAILENQPSKTRGIASKSARDEILTFNGKKFYDLRKMPVLSADESHAGYYKLLRIKVKLYDKTGKQIGGVNQHGLLYQSCEFEGAWYHYPSPPPVIGSLFDYGFSEICNDADNALELLRTVKNEQRKHEHPRSPAIDQLHATHQLPQSPRLVDSQLSVN